MKFKRLMALAMAGVMTLGMAGTAMAADAKPASTTDVSDTVQVKKTIEVAEGITLADDLTFSGTAYKNTEGKYVNPDATIMPAAAEGAVASATISSTGKSVSEGETSIIDYADISINKTLTPGEYTFELTEVALDDDKLAVDGGYGWTQNIGDKTYYLHVYVDSNSTPKYSITDTYEGTTKKEFAEFQNKFTKRGGSSDNKNSLEIKKTVAENDAKAYVDPNTTYEFTVVFKNVPEVGYTYKINGEGEEKTITSAEKTLTLKDGETAVFAEIPAGEKVTITETAKDNVTISGTYVSNGGQGTNISNGTTGEFLIGEHENRADFINTYQPITVTGLAVNVAPFIAMFAAVGAAIAMYVAAKRRVR